MKVSTLRFVIYLMLLIFMLPNIEGNTGLIAAILYYTFMVSVTYFFIKKDGIHLRFWFHSPKKGILKGIMYFPVAVFLNLIVSVIFPFNLKSLEVSQNPQKLSVTLFFITTCIAAPLAEEVMFRGYIQEYLRSRLNTNFTIVLSALIFAAFHPFEMFPYIFVFASFLSYLRERTNSLIPGITVHALNNMASFVMIQYLSGG